MTQVATRNPLRILFASAATLVAALPSHALLRFNDGRDQIYVTFTAGAIYDSNIYTANGGDGDLIFNSGLSLDYLRRAGLIGINGSIGWNITNFDKFSDENFSAPSYSLELTKSTGRTTGSLNLNARETSKPDIDANIRTRAWNYDAGLSLRYPVIERYSIAAQLGYAVIDYNDNSAGLVDLDTYTASADLYYTWTSERDLFFGYRHRHSETSSTSSSVDHNLSAGVSGKILSKLNGSVRVGYQIRDTQPIVGPDETFNGVSASASVTWTVNRRINATASLARDFSTTSTDTNTESTTFTLDGQFAVNAKLSLNARASIGTNEYLDSAAAGREDTYYSVGAGFTYALHEHLTISGGYDFFSNSSTNALSDFNRHTVSLNLTSRW